MRMIDAVAVMLVTAVLAVPVLRFQEGLARGMRTAEAGRYALFMK